MCTCTKIQTFANNGLVNISTANPNLDGSGTLVQVLSVSESVNGAVVGSITIKATNDTSEGQVRLFVYDGSNYFLWKEIYIPASTATTVIESFQTTIDDPLTLNVGYSLYASTQNAESFNVFANVSNWLNCSCTSDCSCTESQSVATTGLVGISTANTNRDGSGSISALISASSGEGFYCTFVPFIEIKATGTTDQGLIGIYITISSTNYLIWEVPISGSTQTGVQPAFRTKCAAGINLQSGSSLGVSTQIANSFNVLAFCYNITNCAC